MTTDVTATAQAAIQTMRRTRCTTMRSKTRWTLAGFMALAALLAVAAFDVAPAAAGEASVVSTVLDPVGDHLFKFDVPFQDLVRGQMTKTAGGSFVLRMELADSVPVNPPLSRHGRSEIWWFWYFNLDPTRTPVGYPWQKAAEERPPEFIVYVSWDGSKFAANAIDRRPLLAGGEAVITPVPFRINGPIVEADLAYALIGDVPASFQWGTYTCDWSGPVGQSDGFHYADYCEALVFFP